MPVSLRNVLDVAVRISNFIKSLLCHTQLFFFLPILCGEMGSRHKALV